MTQDKNIRHPAKYTESFIPIFADLLKGFAKVLDPFAGVGKIAEIKKYGYSGIVYANDIEREWIFSNQYQPDVVSCSDAQKLLDVYSAGFFDAICTSPTYGNRMADHFVAKDNSKRITYTHCLGRSLTDGNTGKMQFGDEYKRKHIECYKTFCDLLKDGGIFILNISNHIRNGQEVSVSEWHADTLQSVFGLELVDDIHCNTPRCRFGANAKARVEFEHIYVFQKRIKEADG